MAAIHPNCKTAKCRGAYVATKSLGLYETESLVLDNESDPTWEHVGQVMGIKQFSFDYYTPTDAQVCIDNYNRGWMRRPKQWGDNWVQIINETTCRNALTAAGYPAYSTMEVILNYIDYWPNGHVYVLFRIGGIGQSGGQYFIKSNNYGGTWYITDKLMGGIWNTGGGGIGIQYTYNANYGPGQVIYCAVHKAFGAQAGFVYSKDMGESFWPKDKNGVSKPTFIGYATGHQRPIASRKYIDAIYHGIQRGATSGNWFRVGRKDAWTTGSTINKTGAYPDMQNGWLLNSYSSVCHPSQSIMYTSHFNTIYYTVTLESALPNPIWNTYTAAERVSDIEEYEQELLFGFLKAPLWGSAQHQTVQGTDDDFLNVWNKSGADPGIPYTGSGSLQTGSIHRNCGGVGINGIALWDALEPIIDDEPPTAGSGWPIWINCEARELRNDPSWDRLYVVAETVWPAGEGLWNQPLLFQFLLSGYVSYKYYENKGLLAFMPTFAQGNPSMYSGDIQYDGHTEMHVEAPHAYQVTCAGLFATSNDQVRYNADISEAGPMSGWQLVGAFSTARATSEGFANTFVDDLSVTTAAVKVPESLSGTPWTWYDAFDSVPFSVNCQLREGNTIWIGSEDADEEQPIRRGNIAYSGWGWDERGGGLPEVPINDIERGI